MKRILITGVAGFIGAHVARRFINEGYKVTGVDNLSGGKFENIPEGVDFIEEDLANVGMISKIPTGCDLILHLAGQSSGEISFDDPVADLQKNTISTLNLIRYGIQNKSKRIVYASSMSVYGAVPDKPINEEFNPVPLSCYGVGKLASESYLRIYKDQLPFVALRMFNVYGPGQDMENMRQGMVSIFLSQAIKSGSIEVKGSVDRFRDFIYIDDIIEGWFRAATYDSALNQVINLGTGCKTTVGSLLEGICSSVKGVNYVVKGSTPGDQSGIYADNYKLKKLLNINSFTYLEDGIPAFVNWALNNVSSEIKGL